MDAGQARSYAGTQGAWCVQGAGFRVLGHKDSGQVLNYTQGAWCVLALGAGAGFRVLGHMDSGHALIYMPVRKVQAFLQHLYHQD